MGDEANEQFKQILSLEHTVRQYGKELEEYGGVLDHLTNTVDTILLPQQRSHTEKIAELKIRHDSLEEDRAQVNKYISEQRGARALVQLIGIIVAAAASVAALIKLFFFNFKP